MLNANKISEVEMNLHDFFRSTKEQASFPPIFVGSHPETKPFFC